MNTLSIEDNEQKLYLVHFLPEACGGPGEVAEMEVAATAMRRPRKEAS